MNVIDEGDREALRIEFGRSIPTARPVRVMKELVEAYGKPNQNAFTERFNRSFRAKVLDAHLLASLDVVQDMVDAWLSAYNEERPHELMGNVTPSVFLPRVFSTPSLRFQMEDFTGKSMKEPTSGGGQKGLIDMNDFNIFSSFI